MALAARAPRLAAALVLVSVRLPLSGYAIAATVDGSSILYGVYWLSGKLGETAAASTVVVGAVGVLSVVAVLASRRPRIGTPVVLGLAMLACGAASAGAVAFDVVNTGLAKKAFLPSDPSWVDRAGLGNVDARPGVGRYARRVAAGALLEPLDRPRRAPAGRRLDRPLTARSALKVMDDGSLVAAGKAVTGPLLMDSYGSAVRLTGASLVEEGPTASLWRPDRGARPRLSLYAIGRYHDGWLADRGAFYLWPRQSGWLTVRLTSPGEIGANTITFQLPGGESTSVQLRGGRQQVVNLAVCEPGAWYATYKAKLHGRIGLRAVSVRASVPAFRADPSACPVPEPVS